MLDVEHGRYLSRNIPNAEYLELPGKDYFIYNGAPDIISAIEEFLTGVAPEVEPDRVLATVMFTDIVGSTDKAVSMGDRKWIDLLHLHDDLIHKNLREYRGNLIRNTGDGMLATFDGPARAIRAAFGIRGGLQEVGFDIRSGLHTGEIELREQDVGGIAFHLGARVMAQAGPSEILVSSTVKDLVVGSGIKFEDRGEHELKGFPDKWRLFAALESAS